MLRKDGSVTISLRNFVGEGIMNITTKLDSNYQGGFIKIAIQNSTSMTTLITDTK